MEGKKKMTKVLYITAHPHDETQSYSMAVGKAFIDTIEKLIKIMKLFMLTFIRRIYQKLTRMYLAVGGNFNLGKDLMIFLQKKKQRFLACLSYRNNSLELINMFL